LKRRPGLPRFPRQRHARLSNRGETEPVPHWTAQGSRDFPADGNSASSSLIPRRQLLHSFLKALDAPHGSFIGKGRNGGTFLHIRRQVRAWLACLPADDHSSSGGIWSRSHRNDDREKYGNPPESVIGCPIAYVQTEPKSAGKRTNQMANDQSTKDQVTGKFHELKGQVKEKAGQVTNNPDLEAEGQDEKVAGKIQKKVGQIENVLGS